MKISCPKCNRTYKVDKQRIPENGLRMRCPQCSTTFVARSSGAVTGGKPSIPSPTSPKALQDNLVASPVKPARPEQRPKVQVGPSVSSLKDPPPPPHPPASPNASHSQSLTPGGKDAIGTELDISLDQSEAVMLQSKPSTSGDEIDPGSSGEGGVSDADGSSVSFGEIELSPLSGNPNEHTPGTNAKASLSDRGEWHDAFDLPAPKDAIDLPAPRDAIDLPAPKDAIDLPAPRDAIDLPAPKDAIDLPAPRDAIDLPAPKDAIDLPAPRDAIDLPAPKDAIDLPTPRDAVDLPAPKDAIDLPTPRDAVDLPAPKDAIDLPTPRDAVDLPTPANKALSQSPNSASAAKPQAEVSREPSADFGFSLGSDIPGLASENPGPLMDATPSPQVVEPTSLDPGAATSAPDARSQTGHTQSSGFGALADGQRLPSVEAPHAASAEASGQHYQIAERVGTSGTTDFGEVDLQPGVGATGSLPPPTLDTEDGEFDAFPTKRDTSEKMSSPGSTGIDLAVDPLDLEKTETDSEPRLSLDEADRKPATAFSGRRKLERQSRRSKFVLLGVLFAILLGGGALTFTPLGPFGAYQIAKLLPSAASDAVVQQARDMLFRKLAADTAKGLAESHREIQQALAELPNNEDLRLLGVFAYHWDQMRFAPDKNKDNLATKLLGSINLDESQSQFAPLVKAAQLARSGKPTSAASALVGPEGKTANGLSILVLAYLNTGDQDKALDAAQKLATAENSARSVFLVARALAESGSHNNAVTKLKDLLTRFPKHLDGILALAKVHLDIPPIDRDRVIALTTQILAGKPQIPSDAQKAEAHAILGRLHMLERNYDLAASAIAKAEKHNPENLLMLIGKGELALIGNDQSTAAVAFNAARALAPTNLNVVLGHIETILREGDLKNAKVALEPLVKDNPDCARAHYLRAKLAWALKDIEVAEAAFQQALALDKGYLEAYVDLSQLYLELNRDADGMKILDQASEAVPNSPLINQTLADAQAARGDYAAAIVELNKAIDIDPEDARSHFRMGQMYRKMNSIEDAERAFDEVEKRDPSYPGLALERGILLELTGQTANALAIYKKALSESAGDLNLKIRLAAASHLLGDQKTAETLLKEIIASLPESAEVNFFLGEVYRVTGRSVEAVQMLKKAILHDNANALYHVRYGMALRDIKDAVQAMEQFKTAEKLDPNLAEAHVRIGQIHLDRGAARSAIESFDRALSLNPGMGETYQFIAEAFDQLSDPRSAVAYYRKAVKAHPDNGALCFKLGLAELKVAGNRTAIGALDRAAKLGLASTPHPDWLPEALYRLGTAQHSTGMRSAAIDSFRRYLEIAPSNHIDRSEVLAHLDQLGG